MLLRGIAVPLGVERGKRRDQLPPRLPRKNDLVDEAVRGSDVRVGELLAILGTRAARAAATSVAASSSRL